MQLVAPPRYGFGRRLGHRRKAPGRLRSSALLSKPQCAFGRELHQQRRCVARVAPGEVAQPLGGQRREVRHLERRGELLDLRRSQPVELDVHAGRALRETDQTLRQPSHVLGPHEQETQHRLEDQAPQREHQGPQRVEVRPLRVVHDEDERARAGELGQHPQDLPADRDRLLRRQRPLGGDQEVRAPHPRGSEQLVSQPVRDVRLPLLAARP